MTAAGPSSPRARGLSVILQGHLVLHFWELLGFAYLSGGGSVAVYLRLTSDFRSTCFFVPSAGTVGPCHHCSQVLSALAACSLPLGPMEGIYPGETVSSGLWPFQDH